MAAIETAFRQAVPEGIVLHPALLGDVTDRPVDVDVVLSVEGDCLDIERRLGLATLLLTLRPIEGEDATLAFEQAFGLFEAMTMQYVVEPTAGGTELEARTEFTLGGVTGSVLDETVVRRQRTSELEAQFDYLERALEG